MKRLQKTQEVEAPNLESSVSSKPEKELLLDEYDEALNRTKNISVKNLVFVFMAIGICLALILPKIYISNQIYYTSKEISGNYHTYTALKEENSHLKRNLELIRYQLEVLDDLSQ